MIEPAYVDVGRQVAEPQLSAQARSCLFVEPQDPDLTVGDVASVVRVGDAPRYPDLLRLNENVEVAPSAVVEPNGII